MKQPGTHTYCRFCGARNDQAHYRGFSCTQPPSLNWPLILFLILGVSLWAMIIYLILEHSI